MTDIFKANPLYIQLKELLKTKYKHNFEDKDDFIYIYHKSMIFCIEPYSCNDTDPNTFDLSRLEQIRILNEFANGYELFIKVLKED